MRIAATTPTSRWPGGATLQVGKVTVLVHTRGDAAETDPPNKDHFALQVEDLDGVCDDLRARGLVFLREPRDYPWGRSAYLRDPDGRLVELAQT